MSEIASSSIRSYELSFLRLPLSLTTGAMPNVKCKSEQPSTLASSSILSISIREISIISKNVGQNKIGSAVDIVKDYYKGMVLYGTEITD